MLRRRFLAEQKQPSLSVEKAVLLRLFRFGEALKALARVGKRAAHPHGDGAVEALQGRVPQLPEKALQISGVNGGRQ